VPTGWGPRGLMLRIGTQSVSPFSAPRTAIGPHCDDGEGNRSVCFSCGAARSARHGAREAVVATAGGLSQDGRRRRSPLAATASHERRRGAPRAVGLASLAPMDGKQRPPVGGQPAAAGLRRQAA
jgi:hypothetical protein